MTIGVLIVRSPLQIRGQIIKFLNTGFKIKYTRRKGNIPFSFRAPVLTALQGRVQTIADFERLTATQSLDHFHGHHVLLRKLDNLKTRERDGTLFCEEIQGIRKFL